MDHSPDREGRIDHLAIAVEDIGAAVEMFNRLLDSEPVRRGESDRHGVRFAMYEIGDVKLELLEGTHPESTVARFVEKRGQGIHHICLAVEDLENTVERLGTEGFKIVASGEETGLEGRPIAFVHPGSSGGVLIEFIEGFDRGEE